MAKKDDKKQDKRVLITEDATFAAFGVELPSTPVQEKK